MSESVTAAIVLMLCALPGIGLGLAILLGKWQPAQLAAARDPSRARAATGLFLLLLNALLVVLALLLLTAPADRQDDVARWGAVVVVAVSTLGFIPLLRAVRA
jgi:hypothetical protein